MGKACHVRSQGQIEAAVCEIVTKLYREFTGRGPDRVSASIDGDILFVRLEGILTCVESRLLDSATEGSREEDIVRSMRARIVSRVRGRLVEALSAAVGRTARCLYHDVAPTNDEEVFVVTFPATGVPRARVGR